MNFAQHFPILDSCTYLNTASSCILSTSLLEWRRQHDLEFFEQGSEFRAAQVDLPRELKSSLSRFFNAKEANIFLVPNFSYGFNTYLNSLGTDKRFLLLQEDYPSVNVAVERRGFSCMYQEIDAQLEENILQNLKAYRPDVFAFSLVQYITGYRMDLEFIRKIKEMYPQLIIIADGTQFCGTERFDFEHSGIDVLIASGYKWMLGGYGNGFVLLKDEMNHDLLPLSFEPGHQDTLALGSLNQSILLLEEFGMEMIEQRIASLALRAKEAFTARGLLEHLIPGRKHSSIFNLKTDAELFEKLLEARISCVARGKGTRVSFHFYNTDRDLDQLLEVIDKYQQVNLTGR